MQRRGRGKRLAVLGAVVAVLALVVSRSRQYRRTRRSRGPSCNWQKTRPTTKNSQPTSTSTTNGFPTVGDYFVLGGEPIFERDRETQVGVARGDCIFVEVVDETAATIECDITFHLERGLITVEGPITFAEEDFEVVQEGAVTGGTDAYKTADGKLAINLSEEEGLLFTFQLIL